VVGGDQVHVKALVNKSGDKPAFLSLSFIFISDEAKLRVIQRKRDGKSFKKTVVLYQESLSGWEGGLAPALLTLISMCLCLRMKLRIRQLNFVLALVACLALVIAAAAQQQPEPQTGTAKKANSRPAEAPVPKPEPFDGASVEKMRASCVSLETELGVIDIEMIPEVAPESVRGFLNLAATGALDTTTFSRIVKDFVIQGGNLTTSEKWNYDLASRMSRKLPDEPGLIKHVRGIVSMARTREPNSATTHFFILVGDGHHLDGKFAAFGRVTKGIEVADEINKAPAEGEKPNKPVRINRAIVMSCKK
jgi:peptidyl-prolyl cis-trans isomerase B (cyclophilin B)